MCGNHFAIYTHDYMKLLCCTPKTKECYMLIVAQFKKDHPLKSKHNADKMGISQSSNIKV